MTKFFTLLLASFILFYSCKTASKSYQKGNYTDAISKSIRELQKDPNDAEARDVLKNSYNYTVNDHEERIRVMSNSKNDDRFEKISQEYNSLQSLYENIKRYPVAFQYLRPKDYTDYIETYQQKAADMFVDRANKWMLDGTKAGYREAYNEFNQALRFRPKDIELTKKRDSAYASALTRVLITEMQNFGGFQFSSSYQMQNFQREVIRSLSYNTRNEFVKFYNEFEARSADIEPDQILELNLSRIVIGQPYDQRSSREVSKEVVVKEIVYKPDSVVKQYATVKARINTNNRTIVSQGDLFITVRDNKGRVLWNDRFTGEHRWQTNYVSYTGDERALSDQDKQLLNNNKNYDLPSEERIMEELFRTIQHDMSYRLRNYYSRLN